MHEKNIEHTPIQAEKISTFRLLMLQGLIVICISIFWVFHSLDSAISVILSGSISILLNLFFKLRFFPQSVSENERKILRNFYCLELLKFVATVTFLLGVMIFSPASFFPSLSGFWGANLFFYCAPFSQVESQGQEARL